MATKYLPKSAFVAVDQTGSKRHYSPDVLCEPPADILKRLGDMFTPVDVPDTDTDTETTSAAPGKKRTTKKPATKKK